MKRIRTDHGIRLEMQCTDMGCRLMAAVVYLIWFAILLLCSRVWKSRVDTLGIQCSRWAEDIITGRQHVEMPSLPKIIGRAFLRIGDRLCKRADIDGETLEKGSTLI